MTVCWRATIGIPMFDMLDQINEQTLIVCELSCHQLEYVTCAPHVGLLLNIHEEHLDHYGTMEKYVAAKENIYRPQKSGDILICNVDNLPGRGFIQRQTHQSLRSGEGGPRDNCGGCNCKRFSY